MPGSWAYRGDLASLSQATPAPEEPMKTSPTLIAAALAALVPAGVALATNRDGTRSYEFRGPVTAVDVATGKVTVDIKGGDRDGLKALIGQPNVQAFTVGPLTTYVSWNLGTPTNGSLATIGVGQTVRVHVRQPKNTPMATIAATAATRIGVVVTPLNVHGPRWKFVGNCKAVNGNQMTLDVTGGNWLALYKMLGQPVTQNFTIDPARTIFVSWNGGPTQLSAAQLPQYCAEAGRQVRLIVVGPRTATLQQALATPAIRVDFRPAPINPQQ